MPAPSLSRQPLLTVTAVLAAMVLAMGTGGCRHARNATGPQQRHKEPSFTVVRAKREEPVDEFMAWYVVSRVLWSDSGIKRGERFVVFCWDGSSISSQSQPLGGVREWPDDAVLALVEPNKPMYPDVRDFLTVTSRWEHWIAPASDQTVSAFAELSRERLLKAHERERALKQRKKGPRAEAGQAGDTVGLVVDADSEVADHAVFNIVVQQGHRRRHSALLVAIWPSGRIVWGKDLRIGGAPYRQGHVSKKALSAFRRRLTAAGVMDGSAFGAGGMFVVSGSSTRIWILWDGASAETGSSRGLYPHAGDGESPEFVKAWETVWDEVRKLIPDESTLLPEYDFQILGYPAPQKSKKPEGD